MKHQAMTSTTPATTPLPGSSAGPSACLPVPEACNQLSRPEHFLGESGDVNPFITQCELHFELMSPTFPAERSNIAFVITHLTGRAAGNKGKRRGKESGCGEVQWQRGSGDVLMCFLSTPPHRNANTRMSEHTPARLCVQVKAAHRRVGMDPAEVGADVTDCHGRFLRPAQSSCGMLSTAPKLTTLESSLRFVVKVNASELGLEACPVVSAKDN
ncbi:uncharacterized protein LOC117518122 [Thalassophryne amazonica]|uniref:uncharacterized protein LOC117518122 n=1 Tax=Thalassophryne amazonica TaxID=390379 RepID=UPI001471C148|nr:uncharacterized protein LOC117518122 [Thalassophryne amazonica]